MTTVLMPDDIWMKHEIEWQALRAAVETKIDLDKAVITNSMDRSAPLQRGSCLPPEVGRLPSLPG